MNIVSENGESVVSVNGNVVRIGKKHIFINDKKVKYQNGDPVIKGQNFNFFQLFAIFALGAFFGLFFSGLIFLQ